MAIQSEREREKERERKKEREGERGRKGGRKVVFLQEQTYQRQTPLIRP